MYVDGVNIGKGTEKTFSTLKDARKYAYQLIMLHKTPKYADRFLDEERGFTKTRIFVEIRGSSNKYPSIYYGRPVPTLPNGVWMEYMKNGKARKDWYYEYKMLDEKGNASEVLISSSNSLFPFGE
jgi:hypothetical protein